MAQSNPFHPVTLQLRGHWHKIAAAVMLKQGLREVVLSAPDLDRLDAVEGMNIVAQEMADGLHLRIVDDKEAQRLIEDENKKG